MGASGAEARLRRSAPAVMQNLLLIGGALLLIGVRMPGVCSISGVSISRRADCLCGLAALCCWKVCSFCIRQGREVPSS